MNFDQLRRKLLDEPIGIHSARLIRVLDNIATNRVADASDDRLLHVMSRVGVFAEGLADALKNGQVSPRDVEQMLRDLAAIGNVSFMGGRRPLV